MEVMLPLLQSGKEIGNASNAMSHGHLRTTRVRKFTKQIHFILLLNITKESRI